MPTDFIPLSVVIPTYNEAANLPELLAQLEWADEIIVIDSMSTDATPDLARAAGATLIERPLDTIGQQKNWAMQQAKHDWVLLLDADERLTTELIQEMETTVRQTTPTHMAYRIKRQNFFLGQPLYYGGLQRDKVVRLVRRSACAYDHKQVHETMQVKGTVGDLQHKLLHYTYKDLSFFLEKQRRYALWSAQDYDQRVPKVTYAHLLLKPLGRFLVQYFLKWGFRDGKAGLLYCAISAWTVFLRYAYLLEKRHI